MLEARDQDLVTGAQFLAPPAHGNEIDGLGGVSHEDDFAGLSRGQERAHPLSSGLEAPRGFYRQLVEAPVDVGVVRLVEVDDCVDHRLGLLCAGGGVEVHERLATVLAGEDGKVAADGLDVVVLDSVTLARGPHCVALRTALAITSREARLPSSGSASTISFAKP